VKNRRNLTPPQGVPAGEVHATRRGGARHEVSARVTLRSVRSVGSVGSVPGPDAVEGEEARVLEGWALNVSRGGVRVILEEKVEPGTRFEVTMTGSGIDPAVAAGPSQFGRVVWVQEEPDGVVAGIEFRPQSEKP
jgi:PilZ domain